MISICWEAATRQVYARCRSFISRLGTTHRRALQSLCPLIIRIILIIIVDWPTEIPRDSATGSFRYGFAHVVFRFELQKREVGRIQSNTHVVQFFEYLALAGSNDLLKHLCHDIECRQDWGRWIQLQREGLRGPLRHVEPKRPCLADICRAKLGGHRLDFSERDVVPKASINISSAGRPPLLSFRKAVRLIDEVFIEIRTASATGKFGVCSERGKNNTVLPIAKLVPHQAAPHPKFSHDDQSSYCGI